MQQAFYKILFCFILLTQITASAQSKVDTIDKRKHLYENAYSEINKMLVGEVPISFKRAVFLMENAFLKGAWTYESFNSKIAVITTKLRQLVKSKHIEQFKTSGNWAAFTYMTDTIPQNSYKPFTYDFENFLPEKDPTVGFVTKLLTTNKGNCNSLPFLYKILTEDVGASASLAIAPIHCYIKHKNEEGKWVNLEMTNGSFARDEWIMQETGVTVEQIKSGIYMNPLSQKESLALILKELADNYQFQFGIGQFDLKTIETALKYYPTGPNLYLIKFEHYRQALLKARQDRNKILEDSCNKVLLSIDKELIALNYKQPSKNDYKSWVRANSKKQ